jgi:hypothetical protein
MADVALQTATEQLSLGSEKDALVSRLDDLLEQYLLALDAYQKAQQQLTQHLSAVSKLRKRRSIVYVLTCGSRAISLWHKQISTTIRILGMGRTATMKGCRLHGGCR